MGVVVYIPTKGRPQTLAKVLPKWHAQEKVDAIIPVIEPQDVRDYNDSVQRFHNTHNTYLYSLGKNDLGINFARNRIVEQAEKEGFKNFIMADDDIYPKENSDVSRLCKALNKTPTLGVGIMLPFYGLMFGNDTIREADQPLFSLNSLGKRLFALHTERVLEAGNFDVRFHSGWGDDELVRQGMQTHGFGWWVHAGVWGASLSNRYTKGGLNALHGEDPSARIAAQYVCHKIAFKKWGGAFINEPAPGKRLICKWRKMLDHFVPDWEELATWRET